MSGLYKAGNDCDASELDFRRPGPRMKAVQARCPQIALPVWHPGGASSRSHRTVSEDATRKRRAVEASAVARRPRQVAEQVCRADIAHRQRSRLAIFE